MIKKLVFAILLVLFSAQLIAQSRLGVKKEKLLDELKYSGYTVEYKRTSFGVPYIKVKSSLANVIYYFDETSICKMCIIFPHDAKGLKYFKDQYNKNYTPASSTKWISTSNGVKAIVELVYTKKGGYFFVWHE